MTVEKDIEFASPKSNLAGMQIGVVGNYVNFMGGGVYGKVVSHCGLDAKPVKEITDAPVAFMVWMNGIVGDGWGWSKRQVIEDIAYIRDRWPGIPVLGNPEFTDDKKVVEHTYEEVFGRPLAVDPTSYVGLVVKKSRIQARHDGEVITCPIADMDARYSYQVLIDNSTGKFACDIRAVIIENEIPFCYVKYRPLESRFSNVNSKVYLVAPRDVFSCDEIKLLLKFSEKLMLEFGEIDVLRDRVTNEIYVVDANNTPSGPPNGLSALEARLAVRFMSNALLAKICT